MSPANDDALGGRIHCMASPPYIVPNVNVAVPAPSAPIVTSAVLVPSDSCHASSWYVPGGRPPIVNVPSSADVAKYGCATTPTYAFIQPCTLHSTGTMISGSVNVCSRIIPARGWLTLKPRLAVGTALMLWSSESLLMISSDWPATTPTTRGWYRHPAWSIVGL